MVEVGKMDIKGSGDIGDLAFNIMSVWRNKKKEKKMEEIETGKDVRGTNLDDVSGSPDAMLHCSKCREDGTLEGSWPLWFHPLSLQYLQRSFDPPTEYCLSDMPHYQDYTSSLPDF